jgi:MinD-like ATPase involved in chromosome partitioning or flagellar assembly
VVGGSGGVGASTFAAVLAATAAGLRDSVLVDLDATSGGIDVLLGVEDVPGPRWSGLRLGGGQLAPDALAEGLPRWSAVAFLAADTLPAPSAVTQLLEIGRRVGPVVVDLGRWSTPARQAALGCCDLVVLVTRADVAAITAARALVKSVQSVQSVAQRAMGAVVRSTRGAGRPERIASLLGVPLIGVLPPITRSVDEPLAADALPRTSVRVARGILDATATLSVGAA